MKTSSLYIASLEPESGSLVISLGAMQLLKSHLGKVAYFRPIIKVASHKNSDIVFMQEHFALGMSYEQSYCFTIAQVEKLQSEDKYDEIILTILQRFKELQREFDFVLCEGMNRSIFNTIFDFDINLDIAKNLQIPYISVLNAKGKNAKELFDTVKIEDSCIKENSCTHFGTFINRLSDKDFNELTRLKQKHNPSHPIFLLPEIEELDQPTLQEVQSYLNTTLLYGKVEDLSRVVKRTIVASMRVEHYLEHIQDGDLVIVSGDRSDIIIASLAAIYSSEFPHICGIVLSGDLKPRKSVAKMLDGLKEYMIPILHSEQDTITTAFKIHSIRSRLRVGSERKIALALGNFSANIDEEFLKDRIQSISSTVMTPTMFEFSLFELAAKDKKRVVLPESEDERILQATEILLRRGVDEIILLGDEKTITEQSARLGLDISKATIINPDTSELKEIFVNEFYEMRKHKGLHIEVAQDAMQKKEYFATMMVQLGYADGMVSGAITTTADTIRPALQIIKTKPDVSIVSSLFFMCLSDKVLVYADCAINQDPDAQALAQIAISSAKTTAYFGIEPQVAMLSYSTGDSGSGEDVEKVRSATAIVKQREPNLVVEG
ncbi:MAG: phosphate acetyltransferase, partial [Campylobacterota bacterium]|nr:phosphate acetyltransferase [Campylobacterota bacterium]